MAGIKKLNSQALELGSRDEFSFVVIDDEVLACIYQGEVLGSLNNKVNTVLDIKDKGRGPVHHVVHIALSCRANDEVVMLHAHVNDALSEIKILVHLMQAVIDANFVVLIKDGFDVRP